MNCSETDIKNQLAKVKANGQYDLLHAASQAAGISMAFVLAIASRETNCTNELGDNFHGVGIMQLDTQHAEAAQAEADGSWKTLAGQQKLIGICVEMLADNMRWAAKTYPQFGGEFKHGWTKISASAYNGGRGNVAAGIREYGDSDYYTTGHDYGKDVCARATVFEKLLKAK